ncbi:MAG TPA: polysaccharide biosynthesis/export family protein [Pyrinomonadaceae bacterium]|jgi:polysaccharide export outer membrane protein
MKVVKLLCALALLTALVTLPLRAQQPAAQGASADSTSGSPETINGVTPKDYPLGPGDIVELRVFGEPQFDGAYDVDADGNITVPFVEFPIAARCRHISEVRKDVITALAKFLRSPQVYMRVKEQHSRQPATVYGAVKLPLRFPMHRRARLLELLSNSGGVTDQSNGTIQITHTESAVCSEPDEVTEAKASVQGEDALGTPFTVYKVADLKLGKPEANPFIRPGDIIYIPEAAPVYITGAVTSPQGVYLRERLALTTAIAMVGGIRKDAKTSEVRIYRQREGGNGRDMITADYRKIQRKQQDDIFLQPYDVIEVPERGVRWQDVVLGFAKTSASAAAQTIGVRPLY